MGTFNQTAANLIINELCPRLRKKGIGIQDSPISPQFLAVLTILKCSGVVDTRDIRIFLDEQLDSSR